MSATMMSCGEPAKRLVPATASVGGGLSVSPTKSKSVALPTRLMYQIDGLAVCLASTIRLRYAATRWQAAGSEPTEAAQSSHVAAEASTTFDSRPSTTYHLSSRGQIAMLGSSRDRSVPGPGVLVVAVSVL